MDRAFPKLKSTLSLAAVVALSAIFYCVSDSEFRLNGFKAYYWVTAYFVLNVMVQIHWLVVSRYGQCHDLHSCRNREQILDSDLEHRRVGQKILANMIKFSGVLCSGRCFLRTVTQKVRKCESESQAIAS
jgi:hypothetical protein